MEQFFGVQKVIIRGSVMYIMQLIKDGEEIYDCCGILLFYFKMNGFMLILSLGIKKESGNYVWFIFILEKKM